MKRNSTHTLATAFLAACVALTMGCASTPEKAPENTETQGPAKQVGEYIDDSVITAKVKAKLIDDNDISATEVNVETYKGVVQLSGFVRDANDITKAGELAREVRGVQSVRNDIRLKESTY